MSTKDTVNEMHHYISSETNQRTPILLAETNCDSHYSITSRRLWHHSSQEMHDEKYVR